jgi:hypothetical protein
MNRFIVCEQTLIVLVREGVRVLALRAEDHEVCDVDDTDAQRGNHFAKECGGSDDFESDFDADANEDARN